MATIRRRGSRFQVQVRRQGQPIQSRTFLQLKDAQAWARQMELQADRHDLPSDHRALQRVTLGELVPYRDTITIRKRSAGIEHIVLTALLSHPICSRRLSELRTAVFVAYRDERLKTVTLATVKRQLAIVRHLFEIARDEWGLPIKENPLGRLEWKGADVRRERRLRPGELDKLIEAANACRNPLVGVVIRLAIETGMRRGESLPSSGATLT